MTGDHHGRGVGRATLLVRAVDAILGTHTAAQAAFPDSARIGDDNAFQLAGLAGSDLRRTAELVRR
jgi:hypothetical protein